MRPGVLTRHADGIVSLLRAADGIVDSHGHLHAPGGTPTGGEFIERVLGSVGDGDATDDQLSAKHGRLMYSGETPALSGGLVVRTYKRPGSPTGTVVVGSSEPDRPGVVSQPRTMPMRTAHHLSEMLSEMADESETYLDMEPEDIEEEYGDLDDAEPGYLVNSGTKELDGKLWRVGFDKTGDVNIASGTYQGSRFVPNDDADHMDLSPDDARAYGEALSGATDKLTDVELGWHDDDQEEPHPLDEPHDEPEPDEPETDEPEPDEPEPETDEPEPDDEPDDEPEPEGNQVGFSPDGGVRLSNVDDNSDFRLTGAEARELLAAADEIHDTDTDDGYQLTLPSNTFSLDIDGDGVVGLWGLDSDGNLVRGRYMTWEDYGDFRSFIDSLRAKVGVSHAPGAQV